MPTLRDVGAAGIKLLGMTYLAGTVQAGFSLVASRVAPGGAADEFLLAQLVGAVGHPVVAWLLLSTADDLAKRLFPDQPIQWSVEARDLLVVGVTLIGLSMAASALPDLLQAAGLAVYYGEASRQAMAGARFEREWPAVILAGLNLVVGLGVATAAQTIAARFTKAAGQPAHAAVGGHHRAIIGHRRAAADARSLARHSAKHA